MKFSLRQLSIFCAIAEQGNVTQAAAKLFLSQSAVSMALAELENQLNKSLFTRKAKKLLLTDAGELALSKAQNLLRQAEEFEDTLKTKAGVLSGKLKIGASTTIGNYLLPALIANFMQRYPKVNIELEINNSHYIINQLQKMNLDVGFIEGKCDANDLEQNIWQQDELILVTGGKHPFAKKKRLSIKDLQTANWVLREKGSGTRSIFEATMAKALSPLDVKLTLPSTEAIKQVLLSGNYVSCLSSHVVQQELQNKSLVRLKVGKLICQRDLLLLTHRDKYHSLLLNKFLEFVS